MRLLVDEKLAPRLASDLADLFPNSIHVSSADLGSTPDGVIWEYAKAHALTFLTKDEDFASLSLTWGAPPKVRRATARRQQSSESSGTTLFASWISKTMPDAAFSS